MISLKQLVIPITVLVLIFGSMLIMEGRPIVKAQQIFYGGSIITMAYENAHRQLHQAVATFQGKIVAVGKLNEIRQGLDTSQAEQINLEGNTLMPAFYDAHSHFVMNALQISQGFDLSPPPIGQVTSIKIIQDNIRQYIQSNNIPEYSIIYGFGYSDIKLVQNRHPNRYDLDQISDKHYIIIRHSSGHIAVANSLVLQRQNITAKSETKKINETVVVDNNGIPTGVLKEAATLLLGGYFGFVTTDIILQGEQAYFAAGITTAQECMSTNSQGQLAIKELGDDLRIDIRGYFMQTPDDIFEPSKLKEFQTNRFKMNGLKFVLDGSIQGYTAFLTKPYYVLPPSSNEEVIALQDIQDHFWQKSPHHERGFLQKQFVKQNIDDSCIGNSNCGFPAYANQTQINEYFRQFYEGGTDILVHCNGDAASDQMIQAVKYAKQQDSSRDNRFVMIHAQTLRQDQLDAMKELGITASFFPAHTFFWGKNHKQQFLGPVRASRMDPAASALSRNMKITLHNDAPVTPVAPYGIFQIIWSAVNRIINDDSTSSIQILGPEQKIPVYQALKAVTITSAWQSRQDNVKGSIQVGKNADLIVISKNPLEIKEIQLRDIQILKTFKNGQIVFDKEQVKLIKK